jgi:hypothetical protein
MWSFTAGGVLFFTGFHWFIENVCSWQLKKSEISDYTSGYVNSLTFLELYLRPETDSLVPVPVLFSELTDYMNANGSMTAAALTFPLFKTAVDFWKLFVGKNKNEHLSHI